MYQCVFSDACREFCITPIVHHNETEPCLKCPTMKGWKKNSIKFALFGELQKLYSKNMAKFLPNSKPLFFRHIIKIDLSSGYNDQVYFNSNPSYDIEYIFLP